MSKRPSQVLFESRLHVLRAERRITQAELAEAVGVTRATINSVEQGNYNPSLDLAFRLALFFGARVDDVFVIQKDRGET